MSTKSKGTNAERELIHNLWANGYAAIRSAGSGSMKAKLQLEALDIEGCEFWDVPEGKVAEIQSFADVLLLFEL